MKNVKFYLMIVVAFALVAQSSAEILTSINISDSKTYFTMISGLEMQFILSPEIIEDPGLSGLILWGFSPSDIGQTFDQYDSILPIDQVNDFKALLTNGIDDVLHISDNIFLGIDGQFPGWKNESEFIVDGTEVDLAGYVIDDISLTINDFTLDNTGGFADYSYDVTFTIAGSLIPEPATLIFLGLGGLVLRRRRQ